MIVNTNVSASWQSGIGEGRAITPPILLWRSVIVRAIMDALDLDIHAWGKQRKKIIMRAQKTALEKYNIKKISYELNCTYRFMLKNTPLTNKVITINNSRNFSSS